VPEKGGNVFSLRYEYNDDVNKKKWLFESCFQKSVGYNIFFISTSFSTF